MMKQCLRCFSYDKERDDLIGSSDDEIIEGEDHADWHYCGEYDGSQKTNDPTENGYENRIPDDIVYDRKKCPLLLDIEKECYEMFTQKGEAIPNIFQEKIDQLAKARSYFAALEDNEQ